MPNKKREIPESSKISTPPGETKPVRVNQGPTLPTDETKPIRLNPGQKVADNEGKKTPNKPEPQLPDNPEVNGKKPRRSNWIWLGILMLVLITAAGVAIGYFSAMQLRQAAESKQRQDLATVQFAYAIKDMESGRYDSARLRLEYILSIYPDFPGLDQKLVEVGIAIAQNQGNTQLITPQPGGTPQPVITSVPTQNTKSSSVLLSQAQAQFKAADWPGLYTTIMNLRNIDPTYEPIKVDGLFYSALRNRGISEIEQGHLEVGLYNFSLAEQLAPIDADAEAYRAWAKMYLNAGSWWAVNWLNASDQFASLYSMVPQLRDSSGLTVTERYARSLAGYGDFLQQTLDWCGAVPQYEKALSIYAVPGLADQLPQAREYCANPPPTPTPTEDPNAPTPTPTEDPNAPTSTPVPET